MDLGGAAAIASFVYSSALKSGSGQAAALQNAFQAASFAGTDASALFGSSDTGLLGLSSQGLLDAGGYTVAQQSGQGQSFVQELLGTATSFSASLLGSLGSGVNGGLEAMNPALSGAVAAYQYQMALNDGTQQAFLQQLTGSNGLNLLG